ncbi:hypothetical protein [Pseudonocardia sp. NPDC049154]|uniref:hypothetical protein n=1 Tax=Pseudonocardia sp. NPDC049154 TaxID=3155501 RepID=UPI00340FDBFE
MLGVMRQAADDLSYFADLTGFFATQTGRWTEVRPVAGMYVVELADGCVIDMHPEVNN